MKKIYILMIAILIGGISKGQWQNQSTKPNAQDIINETISDIIPQSYFSEHIKSPKANKSVSWNFNMIETYNKVDNLNDRITQAFDIYGNANTILFERREIVYGKWINDKKFTFTYDNYGNTLSYLYEIWQNNTWKPESRIAYTYDTNQNLINQLEEYCQNNYIWQIISLITNTYDTNQNIICYLTQNWQNNSWTNQFKEEYSYDTNQNLINSIFKTCSNNTWSDISRQIFTYDSLGNKITHLLQTGGNVWTNYKKYTYTYDSNNNVIQQLYEYWNAEYSIDKTTYTYDTNQNLTNSLREYYYYNAWQPAEKKIYTYDINQNLLTDITQNWDYNSFVNIDKVTNNYDQNNNSITGKYEIYNYNNWHPSNVTDPLIVYSNKKNIFNLYNIYRYKVHYLSFSNEINETTPKQLNLYPNPATNTLTLNLSQLQELQNATVNIYDIQGKELLHQNITDTQTQIDISSFAKGIYIVKFQTDKETLQNKFVKE
jgi:hypothetical protein